VEECLPAAEQITGEFRSGGWYGQKLTLPNDASPQTRLLALFGRTTFWEPRQRHGIRIDERLLQAGPSGP
jgi:hypothetical protein